MRKFPSRHRGCACALAAVVALLAGGCGRSDEVEATSDSNVVQTPGPQVVAVATRIATTAPAIDRARLPGSLAPVRRATLASEVEGRIDRVAVEVGDAVSTGKVLAEVDTAAMRQAVAEAEAVLRQRQAQRDRAEKLFARRAITQQQLLDATTEAEVAQARHARAQLGLSKSHIASPWTGVVARRLVEVGDFVSVGDPMFELIDTRRLEARAQAPASDAPYLRLGLEAEVVVEGFGEDRLPGQITRLGAELDPASHTLAVTVVVDNPNGRYRPGLLVQIGLPRQVYEAALTVPLAALIELENAQAIFVVAEGRAERRVVALGPVMGAEVIVTSGLAVGERVVIAGHRQLSPGQAVTEVEALPPNVGPNVRQGDSTMDDAQ